MRAVKYNKVYNISKMQKDEYLTLGYDIYDDEGKILEHSPKTTVSYAEYEKVVKERDELKAQLNKISGDKFSAMEADELKAYATEHGIDLGNATSKEGIIKKIKASNAE